MVNCYWVWAEKYVELYKSCVKENVERGGILVKENIGGIFVNENVEGGGIFVKKFILEEILEGSL